MTGGPWIPIRRSSRSTVEPRIFLRSGHTCHRSADLKIRSDGLGLQRAKGEDCRIFGNCGQRHESGTSLIWKVGLLASRRRRRGRSQEISNLVGRREFQEIRIFDELRHFGVFGPVAVFGIERRCLDQARGELRQLGGVGLDPP